LLQRRSLASSHVGARVRSKRESSAETCIKISVTESFLQRCERWLARAVPRRNVSTLKVSFRAATVFAITSSEAEGHNPNFGSYVTDHPLPIEVFCRCASIAEVIRWQTPLAHMRRPRCARRIDEWRSRSERRGHARALPEFPERLALLCRRQKAWLARGS
jgi:hypothetical protein